MSVAVDTQLLLDERAFRVWWFRLAIAGGFSSVGLGAMMLAWPHQTALVVTVLVGIWLAAMGVVRLSQSVFMPEGRSAAARTMTALAGLLFLIAGVMCMRHQFRTIGVLALIIGLAWLVVGAVELYTAVSRSVVTWYRKATMVAGVISVIGALVILIWPALSLATLAVLAGWWLIALGVVQFALAWWLRPDPPDRPDEPDPSAGNGDGPSCAPSRHDAGSAMPRPARGA